MRFKLELVSPSLVLSKGKLNKAFCETWLTGSFKKGSRVACVFLDSCSYEQRFFDQFDSVQ